MAVKAKEDAKPTQAPRASKSKRTSVVPISRTSGRKDPGNTAEAKPAKQRKPKMVRDSFTMPENEYAQIAALKKKCLQAGVHVKKSELLRAGLALLATLQDAALLRTMDQVERIKTGRPAKS